MRKFLAILFLLCTVSLGFVPLPVCSAAGAAAPELVQLTDMSFPEFFQLLEAHSAAKGTGLTFDKPPAEPIPGKLYDAYVFGAVRKGVPGQHGVFITAYANKAGYVSKVALAVPVSNGEALQDAYAAEYALLGVVGIEDTKAKRLMGYLKARRVPFEVAVWNHWAQRNLVISHGPASISDKVFYIRLTAYDKTFPSENR
ncbi:hypothetical protein LQE88_05120 [Acidaminococcus sp. NSJ-142]|jgi:hypothetical protein|uniref:hypothetical protein n=1 Tax=Acidaminococcus TaxID=904 RepID=UPI000CF9B256|nr:MULTISPECIES: hypothetical protein [Acidaminococcus]MCD2435371.1 hypothetical protein [Acidaminococcus hominis]MCH4095760.1 hypothetical protein [Acidaminococcus provencensis]RHK01915.1 hypothetical protein DW089_05520 [Acidaminococcus sp. AM05-11]